jgi:dTDP-N-acetylfucosamine:lipid II N-acetylfucosaminyltransferase
MNYHFFIDEKFVDGFISDAQQIDANQKFIVVHASDLKHIKKKDVIQCRNYEEVTTSFADKIYAYDSVFVHWFNPSILSLINNLPTTTKVYLMFYGGDFYESGFPPGNNLILDHVLFDPLTQKYCADEHKNKTKNFLIDRLKKANDSGNWKNIIHTWLQNFQLKRKWLNGDYFEKEWQARKQFLGRLTAICHWNHFDVQLVEELYGVQLIHHYFIYNVGIENLTHSSKKADKTCHTIWLGNSDTPTNNHLDAIEALAHFKDEDIEIICPLNYGNQHYGNVIEATGKNVFGEKFIALRDYLDRESYYNLMDRTDVAVMFHNRGQAGGNVIAFLKKGVKVYMKDESTISQFYKEKGVEIHSANQIAKEDFISFINPDSDDVKSLNLQIISATIGNEKERLVALRKILLND